MGVGDRASCPPTSGMTSHGCQTRAPGKRDRRGNYGKRCMPDRKRNVTPGWFPVRDSGTREAFPRCQFASFSADKECDKPLPRGLPAKIPKAPALGTLSGFCPWMAASSTERPLSLQEHALGLPASASSDNNLIYRTQNAAQLIEWPSHKGLLA